MSQPDTPDGLTEAQRAEIREIIREEQSNSPPITRRDALKGGGLLAALGIAGGGAAGSVAADTGGTGAALSIGSITANTYRIAGNLYGGPASARSELTSELGSGDAGAKYRAEDTGAWYHWTGSGWQLMDGKVGSFSANQAHITNPPTNTDQDWLADPSDDGKAPLTLRFTGTTQNSEFDPVTYWGYNAADGGTREDTTTHAFWHQVEGHFVDGNGDTTSEWSINQATDAGKNRVLATQYDQTNDQMTWDFAYDPTIKFVHGVDTNNGIEMGEWNSNGFQIQDDKRLQLGSDGDFYFTYPSNNDQVQLKDDAGNFVLIADTTIPTQFARGIQGWQRGKPASSEVADGRGGVYISDGTDSFAAGDLVYFVNDAGTIKTSKIADRGNAT